MMRLTPDIIVLIQDYREDSPETVALMSKRYPDLPMAFVAQQVKARQRIRKKLPRWYANESIVFPHSLFLEQCSSEYAAEYKAGLLEGVTIADLTGGFGVDAIAFSERFKRVFYIERNRELSEMVAQNVLVLGKESQVETFADDGLDWLDKYSGRVDVVYLDPARRDNRSLKVSALEDCEPNLKQYWKILLRKSGKVAVKLSPGLDVDRIIASLPHIFEIHILSIENECKECFCIAREEHAGEPEIVCVNRLNDSNWDTFIFKRSEEKASQGSYSMYSKFLYEPNASIMKGGGFKTLGDRLGLALLHPRTRFYSSEQMIEGFPGKVFEILDSGELQKKGATALFPEGQANVLARNAGLSSPDLKRKLGLRDGGDLFAIGTTDVGGRRRLLKCRKVERS